MNIKNTELEFITNSYERLGKIKGLFVWQEILHNKIKSKGALKEMASKFEATRKEILEELCEKDEVGKPVIKEDKYSFIEDNEAKAVAAINTLAKETGDATVELDLKVINISEFKRIEGEAELADILEPLMVNGLLNEN